MNTTYRTSAAALAAALATAALVVPAATARQADDPAQADMRASVATALAAAPKLRLASAQVAPRELSVRLKVAKSTFVMHKKKIRMGDTLVERQRMFDAGDKPIGSAYIVCVNMGGRPDLGRGVMQCQATYDFADGQIVAAGVVDIAKLDQLDAPIVGGSGAYRGAKGELNAGAPVKGYASVDVLKLDG